VFALICEFIKTNSDHRLVLMIIDDLFNQANLFTGSTLEDQEIFNL
jgi:hypothetical protein